jgi:ubiquinone/menaquinone biosynthesis C-methylase UbiE
MGENPPAASEQNDIEGAEVHRKIFAANSGKCMETDTGTCLNLGSGKVKWPNWVSVDFTNADVECDLKALPFDDDYADAIAAIHVLEHFYAWEVGDLLQEWKRVLKPDGKIILELPCMDKVVAYMLECISEKRQMAESFTWFAFWGDPKYKDPHMCHKWGYSKASLQNLLENSGFKNIRFETPNYHFPQRDMRVVAYK